MDPVSSENLVHQPNKFYTVTEYTDTRHCGLTDISWPYPELPLKEQISLT